MKSHHNSKQPAPAKAQPNLEPEAKLTMAQNEAAMWSKVAASPNLSPQAASVAMNAARSAAAEVKLRQKALAYQSPNQDPPPGQDQPPPQNSQAASQASSPLSPSQSNDSAEPPPQP